MTQSSRDSREGVLSYQCDGFCSAPERRSPGVYIRRQLFVTSGFGFSRSTEAERANMSRRSLVRLSSRSNLGAQLGWPTQHYGKCLIKGKCCRSASDLSGQHVQILCVPRPGHERTTHHDERQTATNRPLNHGNSACHQHFLNRKLDARTFSIPTQQPPITFLSSSPAAPYPQHPIATYSHH